MAMQQIEALCTQLSEAVFGRVPTREERMAKLRDNLDGVVQQAEADAVALELRLEDAERERKQAARKGDERAMHRAARKTVRTEREHERLQERAHRTGRELQQMKELEGDHVLLESKLQMVALTNQARPLPSRQAMQHELMLFQHNTQHAKLLNEEMRDAMEEAQGSRSEDSELSADGEERVQALVKHSRDLVNQKKFADLPKPHGSLLSSTVLSESPVDMALRNREETRRLESHLAGGK